MQIQNKQRLIMDLRRVVPAGTPHFRQYDNNILEIEVLDNGVAADLTNVAIATAVYKRPDGETVGRTVTKEENIITYKIGNEESKVPGEGEFSIQFYGEDKRISSLRIRLSIDETLEPEIEGTEDLTLLQELFVEVSEKVAEIDQTNQQMTEAEAQRATAEDGRETAEANRVQAEESRESAETVRVNAESDRADAETIRARAESDRASAEINRVEAEGNRESAEQDRASAEALRVQAEDERQTAETSRNQAEEQRQTNTSQAIQNAETATQNAQRIADQLGYQAPYDSDSTYQKNNVVSLDGSSFISLVDNNTGNVPDPENDTPFWGVLSKKGRDGTGTVNSVNEEPPDANGNVQLSAEKVGAIPASEKGQPGGTATLGDDGKLLPDQLDVDTSELQTKADAGTRQIENIGYGVQTGLDVTVSAVPNMNVTVQPGVIYMPDGKRFAFIVAATVTVAAADATNPRKDIIFVAAEGSVQYLAGTPAVSAVEPALPAGALQICIINVPAGDKTIEQAQVVDKRAMKKSLAAHLAADATNAHTIGNITGLQAALDARSKRGDLNGYRVIYVNPAIGLDTNPGTDIAPFKTIKGAIDNTSGSIWIYLSQHVHVIDAPINIVNRYVGFHGTEDTTSVTIQKPTSNIYIYCVDASIGTYGLNIKFDGILFTTKGKCSFAFGGYQGTVFSPITNTNCRLIYASNALPSANIDSGVSIISISLMRATFKTTAVAGYTSVFNIVLTDTNYVAPSLFIKYQSIVKEAQVFWVNGTDGIAAVGSGGMYAW